MKKTLLFIALIASFNLFAQTQPIVHNATFDKIPKNKDSDCTCSGWINKDIADQGESSDKNGSDVVKFDALESDGVYQEVAVQANSTYTLDLEYTYGEDPPTTTTHFEIVILKGSGYIADYTPLYAPPATAEQSGFGYETIAQVENASNQISYTTYVPVEDTQDISQISFHTGSETSIAIFIRAVGPFDDDLHNEGTQAETSKNKGWMNGDSAVRIDNLVLVNLGPTASLENNELSRSFNVYPNPASGRLFIKSNEFAVSNVTLFNVMGQKVLEQGKLAKDQLDISGVSKGIYILKVTSDSKSFSQKIIIE